MSFIDPKLFQHTMDVVFKDGRLVDCREVSVMLSVSVAPRFVVALPRSVGGYDRLRSQEHTLV